MNTKTFISFLKRRAPSWTREDLREFTDSVQKHVFGVPVGILRHFDSTTGKDPVLNTTSGVFVYELTLADFGADIQHISKIYTDSMDNFYYNSYTDKSLSVSVKKAVGSKSATITFHSDPGDAEFFIECYRKPSTLYTEGVEMDIPEEYLFPYIQNGVIGLIEQAEHGNSNAYDRFVNSDVLTLRSLLNNEAQSYVYFPDYSNGGF